MKKKKRNECEFDFNRIQPFQYIQWHSLKEAIKVKSTSNHCVRKEIPILQKSFWRSRNMNSTSQHNSIVEVVIIWFIFRCHKKNTTNSIDLNNQDCTIILAYNDKEEQETKKGAILLFYKTLFCCSCSTYNFKVMCCVSFNVVYPGIAV